MGGRVQQLSVIGPDSGPLTLDLSDGAGYLSASLPNANGPRLITGFLDFGDFGEDDAPKKDLQYTFSAQTFSTNPFDDWIIFFHNFKDMVSYTEAFPEYQPFAIALRNYGPPYEVVVRGVSENTVVDVCLYEGNGSNRKIGCGKGNTEGTNQLMIDSISEILNPCETYFALANTTGVDFETGEAQTLWSSTSVTWNGPCAKSSPRAVTVAANSAPVASSPVRSSPVIFFGAGLLVGMAGLFLTILARRNYQTSEVYPIREEPIATTEEEADTMEMN